MKSHTDPLATAFVEARDSAVRQHDELLAGWRPKNPNETDQKIITLIESMSPAQNNASPSAEGVVGRRGGVGRRGQGVTSWVGRRGQGSAEGVKALHRNIHRPYRTSPTIAPVARYAVRT